MIIFIIAGDLTSITARIIASLASYTCTHREYFLNGDLTSLGLMKIVPANRAAACSTCLYGKAANATGAVCASPNYRGYRVPRSVATFLARLVTFSTPFPASRITID